MVTIHMTIMSYHRMLLDRMRCVVYRSPNAVVSVIAMLLVTSDRCHDVS